MGRLYDLFLSKYNYTDFHELNLDWLISAVKELLIDVDNLEEWKKTHEEEYNELKELYDDIMAGDFPESIKNAFHNWMLENAADLVGDMVNLVIFNITDDGYFVAYIPDSWDEIQFGTTGLDTFTSLQPEYGHLVLSYEASTNAY